MHARVGRSHATSAMAVTIATTAAIVTGSDLLSYATLASTVICIVPR